MDEDDSSGKVEIEYYDDWWDSDNYFVCINRHYIFAANRNDKSPQWMLINSNYDYWDAIHQRIYRNYRSDKIRKEDLPTHFPPPPETIPPEAINPPPPPPPPLNPIPADRYPVLTEHISELNGKSKLVYLVLEEDLYESMHGDGEFHYPSKIFFDSESATLFVSRDHHEYTKYHSRQGLIQLTGGILECDIQPMLFDHFSSDEVLSLANQKIVQDQSGKEQTRLGAITNPLRYLICQVIFDGDFPPTPNSDRAKALIRSAETARLRQKTGVVDSFLFIVIGCCDLKSTEISIRSYGFQDVQVRVIGSDKFDNEVPENDAAHVIEMWLMREHRGAIPCAPSEYDNTEFWWSGVEWCGDRHSLSNMTNEFPEPFRDQDKTWQGIIHNQLNLCDQVIIGIDELFVTTMSVYEASLCEWLHGFNAACDNGYNHFDAASVINTLGLPEAWLCSEFARRSGRSIKSLCEEHDVDEQGLSEIALGQLTADVRYELRGALSKFFGGDTALLWALYSTIWPKFDHPMMSTMNDLVMKQDQESVAEIIEAWDFVQHGWSDAADK